MVSTKDEFFQGLRRWATDERKLEFIEKEIAKGMPTEVKIAALVARAEIYLKKRWPALAARDYCAAANFATTFRERSELFFKGATAFLAADDYLSADDSFRKVIALSAQSEKQALKEKIKALYLEHASSYEKKKNYTKAITAFENALNLDLDLSTRLLVYDHLITLYERVGNPFKANQIKQQKVAAQQLTQS